MAAGKEVRTFSDGDVYTWVEPGGPIMLKAVAKPFGDPVELTSEEARKIALTLFALADEADAGGIIRGGEVTYGPERVRLLLAIQTGLLSNVTPAMRVICVRLVDGVIELTAFFEREPSEDEREMLLDASLDAANAFVREVEAKVECIVDEREMGELMRHLNAQPRGALVYMRHELGYG
jgi:hypothetical protein